MSGKRAEDLITPFDEQRKRAQVSTDGSHALKREQLRKRAQVLCELASETLEALYDVDAESARWELDALTKRTDALYLRIVKGGDRIPPTDL